MKNLLYNQEDENIEKVLKTLRSKLSKLVMFIEDEALDELKWKLYDCILVIYFALTTIKFDCWKIIIEQLYDIAYIEHAGARIYTSSKKILKSEIRNEVRFIRKILFQNNI